MAKNYVKDAFKGRMGVPLKFQIVELSGVQTATSKQGKPYSFKLMTLRDEFGNQYEPEKTFDPFTVNDWLVGMIPVGEAYPKWSLAEGIDPNKLPEPSRPAVAAPYVPQQPDWDEIAASKIIHNFMRDAYAKGKNPDLCGADAVAMYRAQLLAVKLAYQGAKEEVPLPAHVVEFFNSPERND